MARKNPGTASLEAAVATWARRQNPLRISDGTTLRVEHADQWAIPLGPPETMTFGEWSKSLKRSAKGLVMVGGRQFRDMTSVLRSARMTLASNGNAPIYWTTSDGDTVITRLRVP
jgi:hypothetical protein